MARGDQPLRRAAAAGDLLRAEQPDGAVHAGRRAVGGARLRRQGGGLRHPRHHDRRHRSRRDRRGVRLGGRARARRAGAGAHRARVACACAATRITTTCSISARIRSRRGTIRRSPSRATPTASSTRYWARARSDRRVCGAARGRGRHRAPATSSGSSARPRRWSRSEARAVIDAPWPDAGRRRARASSPARRRGRAIEVLDPRGPRRRSTYDPQSAAARARRRRSIRRAARSSKR